ncbi:SDR family NAD(P)-dependent oxidoreductase [Candidatus Woesearchaeota archaeon]|nr:SDR family NAD(P)-dependent oxidoreductase [Candidatus Woesearchaeota archaeon]
MKILITGSSGTIGTRLCEKLIEKGHEVIGIDWRKNKWNKQIDEKTIHMDLREKEKILEQLPKDIDLVIHLAANARVYDLVVDPSRARDNFETLFNVLEYTRQNNIKKFMFASSREVYGNSEKITHNEEEAYVKNCESPYTGSKVAGESMVHAYQQCYGINFVIFRFSNVYGMYDDSNRVIPLFIEKAKKGEDLIVYGKEKLLDFTYIDDTINGIIKCIEKFDEIKNDTFNLSYGKGNTILKVAEIIKNKINSDIKIIIKENRTGEVVKFVADISKAQNKLDYKPEINIKEGIKNSIEWFENNVKK